MGGARGGAREGAGRKPYPDFRPDGIVIDVRDARAYVSIWRRDKAAFWLEPATAWEVLEDAAIEAIEAQGGYVTLSGIYPCPPELAEKAEFKEKEPT